jgi:hypothetical protein
MVYDEVDEIESVVAIGEEKYGSAGLRLTEEERLESRVRSPMEKTCGRRILQR